MRWIDDALYQQLRDERLMVDDVPDRGSQDPAITMLPATLRHELRPDHDEPVARTAAEQDHTNPWDYAGAPAGPPGSPS